MAECRGNDREHGRGQRRGHWRGHGRGRGRGGHGATGGLFNLAVIGKSNSGKSSFIKAMFHSQYGEECGINPEIDYLECTSDCNKYQYPDSPVVFWDVPGCGTVNVPSDEYASKINMDRYDGFIICCSGAMSEYELALHNLIAKRKKYYVFVRTNVETALSSEKEAHRRTFNKEETLKTLRQKIESHVAKTGTPIFLVDNHHPDEFDFPNLRYLIFEGELSGFMRHAYSSRGRREKV